MKDDGRLFFHGNNKYRSVILGYKLYALSAILLLALWPMLSGTLTLRCSDEHNLIGFTNHYVDVLDMEEREKLVSDMWDVYVNSPRIILSEFWQDAFVAAYEELTSDLVEVRDEAISHIARMSARYINLPSSVSVSVSSSLQDLNLEHVDHSIISTSSRKKIMT